MIKKILIIIFFYFLNIGQITIANESDSRSVLKDIKTRGSGGKIINIQPRKDINIFKSNLEKRSKLKNYTKLLSASLTKQPKRIQTRGVVDQFIQNLQKLLSILVIIKMKMLDLVF